MALSHPHSSPSSIRFQPRSHKPSLLPFSLPTKQLTATPSLSLDSRHNSNRRISFAASHDDSKQSEVEVEKEGVKASQEEWEKMLESFKQQTIKMQGMSKEAYQAAVILNETSQKLKIQAEKASQDLSVIAKDTRDVVETLVSLPDLKQVRDFHLGIPYGFEDELDQFVEVGNKVADAAGEVISKYFRKNFEIVDKEDLSPVTIADRNAEEAMVKIIQENLPSHAIFGEENGWNCKEDSAEYVWVLDPIDGTKSFITGKPVFGTLIALLHKGVPIVGIIDQPILKERWIGMSGRQTTLNGKEVSTRSCSKLSQAYLYTTSPHLFSEDAGEAFARVRNKVKVPLYGCDCYAYALLASGFVDLVVESGLKPYDFLSLLPVIQGAGGVITDWSGNQLHWEASSESRPASYNVVAAGDKEIHQQALDLLQWK